MIDIELRGRLNASAWQAYLRKIDFVLDALGEMTTDQIRKLFQLNNAKGSTCNPCGCPVAVYMQSVIGRKVWVETRRAIPIYGRDNVPPEVMETSEANARDLPISVQDFTINFDTLEYPELMINNG